MLEHLTAATIRKLAKSIGKDYVDKDELEDWFW